MSDYTNFIHACATRGYLPPKKTGAFANKRQKNQSRWKKRLRTALCSHLNLTLKSSKPLGLYVALNNSGGIYFPVISLSPMSVIRKGKWGGPLIEHRIAKYASIAVGGVFGLDTRRYFENAHILHITSDYICHMISIEDFRRNMLQLNTLNGIKYNTFRQCQTTDAGVKLDNIITLYPRWVKLGTAPQPALPKPPPKPKKGRKLQI